MKDLSKSIMDKRTESVIENFSTEESPGPDGFTGEFYRTFKELLSIFLQFLKKKKKGRERKTSIPKPEEDTTRKGSCRSVSLTNKDAKIPSGTLARPRPDRVEKIGPRDRRDSSSGWKGGSAHTIVEIEKPHGRVDRCRKHG